MSKLLCGIIDGETIMREKRNCVVCGSHHSPPTQIHPGANKRLNLWEFLTKYGSNRKTCSPECAQTYRYNYQNPKRIFILKKIRDKKRILNTLSCTICSTEFQAVSLKRKTCGDPKCVKENSRIARNKHMTIWRHTPQGISYNAEYRKSNPQTIEQKQKAKIYSAERWKRTYLENKPQRDFNKAVNKIKRQNCKLYTPIPSMITLKPAYRFKHMSRKSKLNYGEIQ